MSDIENGGLRPEAEAILDRMGMDRVGRLQTALLEHAEDDGRPNAIEMIGSVVASHIQRGARPIEEIGIATVADALADIALSKGASRALLRGKMGIVRAVNAHHARAEKIATESNIAELQRLGTSGAPTIWIDKPSGLNLVRLLTPEHCQYEGVSLVHCLGDIAVAREYLDRGALLYSLRLGGKEPRATLEVDAQQSAIIQARKKHDMPLHRRDIEYQALMRSIHPLSLQPAHYSGKRLTITDTVHG